jgi:hypothetical protein
MKHRLETRIETDKDGQVIQLYCKECNSVLSEEFYNGSGVVQFLGVRDCVHFQWIFVGEPYLQPPQDPETKKIVSKSIAKVDANNSGKYFLLPKRG